MDFVKATHEVGVNGPKRVIINSAGETTTAKRALLEHRIVPTVVFLRDDGWTLGAPHYLRDSARAMWAGSWVAVMEDYPEGEFKALTT